MKTLQLIAEIKKVLSAEMPNLSPVYDLTDITGNHRRKLDYAYSIVPGSLEIDGTSARRAFTISITRGEIQTYNDRSNREESIRELFSTAEKIRNIILKKVDPNYRFYFTGDNGLSTVIDDNPDYFLLELNFENVYSVKRDRC